MSDPSNEFETVSRPKNKALEGEPEQKLVELVKFLARISARRDYNRLIQEQNKPKGDKP